MNSTKKALLGAALLGLSAPMLQAQDTALAPTQPSQPIPNSDAAEGQLLQTAPSSAINGATGLQEIENGWIGGGSDWEALFEDSRVRFLPVLPNAPVTAELTWKTSGVARGNGPTFPLITAEPQGEENGDQRIVRYQRGFVTETYEMRLDGLKQSFVFQSLPAGTGDLVVRGTIDSILPFAEQGDQGLRFETQDIGAVTIGQVTGFDANGNSVEGSIVFDGRNTEFRLPGDWVETAQLPIIVDPLIGTEQQLGSTTSFNETRPQAAYDASEDVYFVIWRREFSTSQILVRGQRLNGDGTLLGSVLFITPTATVVQTDPDVANVSTTNSFGVVWAQAGDILCRRVNTAGQISGEVAVASTANTEFNPQIGGESSADDDAMVVYDDQTLGIRARSVTFPNSGDPFLQQVATVVDNTNFPAAPSISKSGGATGNHLIVWNDNGGTGSNNRVMGRVYNRNVGALTAVQVIESVEDADFPQCDGNGSLWIVAWEEEPMQLSGDNDVAARACYLSAAGTIAFSSSAQDVANGLNDDERGVDVAWMGSSALITWADEAGTNSYDAQARPIDCITALPLFTQTIVGSGPEDQDFMTVCSTFSGDPNDTTEEALFAWQETGASFEEIRIRRWGSNRDGTISDRGGNCGPAGNFYVGSAILGNQCQLVLTDAPTSQSAILVFSFDELNAACGTCTLVPNPFTGISQSIPTSSDGNVRAVLNIPTTSSLRGTSFFAQWGVTESTSPACTLFDLDFSAALRITIQ